MAYSALGARAAASASTALADDARAKAERDAAEKKRVWDVIDYDLSQFWPGGPTDPNYALVRIDPTRVELSKMFGSQDVRVWRAA